jgi:hypothetical protein
VPAIHIVDQTWIAVPRRTVADLVGTDARWSGWWPQLRLAVTERRGPLGVRWAVLGTTDRQPARGTMEVWLQEQADGVVLHYFLRLELDHPKLRGRALRRAHERHRRHGRRICWAIKDELESGRRSAVDDAPDGTTVASPSWPTSPPSRSRSTPARPTSWP